jgi:glycosyltransferase involved in cell wall biosynthesis
MRIAMIGTRGVPARYGGFETCVEEVGSRLAAAGHDVTVYCRAARGELLPDHYRGMRLVRLPALRRRSLETLSHTALSVAHTVALGRPEVALVFNAANAPLLPLLRARGIPVATHVDGLEWKRAKWGPAGKRYYRLAEALSVRWSDGLIADAQGIADYYAEEFHAFTELITYGAPSVTADPTVLTDLDLTARGYHLVVARFEPENHVLDIVRGHVASSASKPLVVVGGSPYAAGYTSAVEAAAAGGRVRLLGGVWDQDVLDQLYANAFVYWHGHSVGGTNPSLLRAIGSGTATNAYDVSFNREVLGESGRFWSTPGDVRRLLEQGEADPTTVGQRALAARDEASRYNWDDVAEAYAKLCSRLVDGSLRRSPGLSGRRRASAVASR